ncbi:MAG: hypothetical protein RL757_645 [Bacteroidota bacterium]|jgi:hypothetical protein
MPRRNPPAPTPLFATDENGKTIIPAEEFIKIWRGDYRADARYKAFYADIHFTNMDYIPEEDGKFTGVLFKNCIVKEPSWKINDIEKELPIIVIEDCEFEELCLRNINAKAIQMNNSKINNWLNVNQVNINHIIFSKNNIAFIQIEKLSTNRFSISNCQSGNISIWNSIINGFKIEFSEIYGLMIHDSAVAEKIFLYDVTIDSGVVISYSEVYDFDIRRSKAENVSIQHHSTVSLIHDIESTIKNFSIASATIDIIRLSGSQIEKFNFDTSISEECSINDAKVSDINVKKATVGCFTVQNTTTKIITIKDSNFVTTNLIDITIEKVDITSINSEFLKCQFKQNEAFLFLLRGNNIRELHLIETFFSENSHFHFDDCNVQNIYIYKCYNFGKLIFSNLKPINTWNVCKKDDKNQLVKIKEEYKNEKNENVKSFRFEKINDIGFTSLMIAHADLGKISFIQCDLSKFNGFYFANSELSSVFLGGSILPSKIISSDIDGYNSHEQRRLLYLQLKKSYENRGDTPNALRYLSLEMNAYEQILKKEGGWRKNFGELTLLRLNKWSNNFGTSWLRGVAMTFGFAGLFLTAYCLLLGYRLGSDLKLFFKLGVYIFEYLNPLRSFDFLQKTVEDNKPTGASHSDTARLVDYLARIVVAYLVYQTIAAFRKLGKSGS